MKTVFAAAVVAALAGSASAAIAFDPEFLGFGTNLNNTIATASNLGTFNPPGEGILVDGSITPGTANGVAGDVDWFSFTIAPSNSGLMVASIFTLTGSNAAGANDTFLVLADASGNILAFNDDDNVGLNSSLAPVTLAAGTYFVGVTAFGDTNGTTLPDGLVPQAAGPAVGHVGNFTYKLIIGLTVVPTPGAAALVGLGALAAGRRRR
jgi:hypothetical protein